MRVKQGQGCNNRTSYIGNQQAVALKKHAKQLN